MSYDAKLREAVDWPQALRPRCQNEEFEPIAETFKSNLDRVKWNAQLLPWLVGKATLYEHAAAKIQYTATEDELNSPTFSSDIQPKIHAFADRDEAAAERDQKIGFDRDEEAYKGIDFFLAHYGHEWPDGKKNKLVLGFQALFESMLIGTWTAVEIALEDLHNTSRQILDGRHQVSEVAMARIESQALSNRKVSLLPTGKYRDKWKSPNFQSLRGTRIAYSCWFHDDSSEIDEALSSLDLDALAAMRNLIVHSACLVDQHYRDQAQGVPSLSDELDLDLEYIELNGKSVQRLIVGAIQVIPKLITAVDDWTYRKLHPAGQGDNFSP